MVFENLTLVELHLENSRFSAERGGESAEAPEEVEAEEESGGGRMGRVLALVLFFVVAGAAVRRYRSGGEDGGAEGVEEAGGITIEESAD